MKTTTADHARHHSFQVCLASQVKIQGSVYLPPEMKHLNFDTDQEFKDWLIANDFVRADNEQSHHIKIVPKATLAHA